MKHVVFAILATLTIASSAMVSLELPKQNFDDIAFLKYSAHSGGGSAEAVMAVVEAQNPTEPVLARFHARLGTVHTYPLLLAIVSTLDRWFMAYDYLSVFLAFFFLTFLALLYWFFVRVRFPSEKTRSIDLAFLLLGLNITAGIVGLWKFFPFTAGGYYWYDLYPRAVIEILLLSQLYLHFSSATRRTKIVHGVAVLVASLTLNVIFAGYLALLVVLFLTLTRLLPKLRFEFLFPSMFVVAMLIGVSTGMHPHVTLRAILWLLYALVLLFVTRKEGNIFARNAFIFLSAFCLAGQFFDYNAPDANLIWKEMMFRPLGLAGFFFMFLCAERLSSRAKERLLLFLAVPVILTAYFLSLHAPQRTLFQKSVLHEVPAISNETDFFLYFSRATSGL